MGVKSFWDTDLWELENSFLPKGIKITDLPTTLDKRVPHQGSVLLDRVVNIDNVVSKPSFVKKLIFNMSRKAEI